MKGLYRISNYTCQSVIHTILEFGTKYHRHKKEWSLYSRSVDDDRICLEMWNRSVEPPRGGKPTMPKFDIRISEIEDLVIVKWRCIWPMSVYVLFSIAIIMALGAVWFLVADFRNGIYVSACALVGEILFIHMWMPYVNYRKNCVLLFHEIMSKHFSL